MIHSIFDSILLYPRFNSRYYSIQKKIPLIQFKRKFNSIVRESLILVKSEKCPKSVQNRQKLGAFYQKLEVSIQYCLPTIQYSGDSVQRIIQFNSQGIIDIGQIRKVPKKCPTYTEKGAFYQKSKI